MTSNIDGKMKRLLPAAFAAAIVLTATFAFTAFPGSALADHRDHGGRGGDRGGHRDGYRGGGWGGGYYNAPPVVYGTPYYAPPVVYGPGFGLNLNIR
jgi:hypothetical protein